MKRNSRNINKSTRRERSRPFPTHALTPPDIAQAITSIKRSKNIVIAGHLNPDGDSLGSMLALGLALGGAGKHVYMISPNGVPARYRYLPGADKIRRGLNGRGNPDLAIAVDCSNKEILGGSFSIFRRSRYILEIDHHDYRRPFGDISVIDTKASAVGELVYILLKELGSSITRDVAENLLTSIVVETSSFRLPNVRPFTFEICSSLMKTGVDFYRLIDTIYWSRNRKSAVLSGICLSRCRFISNNRIAWSIIRKSDFDSVGGKDEDVDAVAEEIRAIKGVKMVILFRERGHGRLRVSLRSKGAINIGGLAEEFGGGGHFDIAGCAIPNTKRAIELFLDRAKYFLKVPRYDG